VDLHTVEWYFAGRYCELIRLLLNRRLVTLKFTNQRVFADDLTSNDGSYQQALTSLVLKATDICFYVSTSQMRIPFILITIHYRVLNVIQSVSVVLQLFKIFGKTIGNSPTATRKLTSDNVKQRI